MRGFVRLIALSLLMLAGLAPAAQDAPPAEGETFWWNERVFYQIFVRSFYDSNGDGIGDFKGLTEKLDYLNDGDPNTTDDLGITGIWLMPIMPSPSEHGYDITDYYDINPDYGTMEDFQAFLDAAHQRGIAVVIDLVINHTSSQHPWFTASAAGDPEYADYYVWADENPNYRGPYNQDVWHRRGDRWYYGVFVAGMPDLNYTNPAVTQEMYDIATFWLEDVGVDGFRVDAVKYIVEEGRAMQNTASTHTWLKDFHAHVKAANPDAVLIGEIWDSTTLVLPYVGGEMDIAFEFDLAGVLIRGASFGLPGILTRGMQPILDAYPAGQFASFLANHDQDRAFTQMQNSLTASRLGAAMLLTLPGVPFIYYGEEIAMEGKRTLATTDNERRTPMQWDASAGNGFTTGTPWFRINPSAAEYNVAAQTDAPDSLLSLYRDLIQLRDQTPALQSGTLNLLTSASRRVIAFTRSTPDQTVLVLINTDDKPHAEYAINGTLPTGAVSDAVLLLGDGTLTPPTTGSTLTDYTPLPELAPFSVTVIELLP